MSDRFLVGLIEEIHQSFQDIAFYVFCSPKREEDVNRLLSQNASIDYRAICYWNIWDSLSCVQHCDLVIGMDSCVKTLSAILRIPTMVLVGDYNDPYRDEVFLRPYISENIMTGFFFKDIDRVNSKEIVEYIKI
jgi:ADP-heptose:LPS heptosyltransferase